jgi:hypothetical protein
MGGDTKRNEGALDTNHTTPKTTVARKLTLLGWLAVPGGSGGFNPLSAVSKYSSVRELDFQPQLWLIANTSGALEKRVSAAPVALWHAIVKYAVTAPRESRYACAGALAGAAAGMPSGRGTLCVLGIADSVGRGMELGEETRAGVMGRGMDGVEAKLCSVMGSDGPRACVRSPRVVPACANGAPERETETDGSASTVDCRWR